MILVRKQSLPMRIACGNPGTKYAEGEAELDGPHATVKVLHGAITVPCHERRGYPVAVQPRPELCRAGPALFQPRSEVRARPGPSGEALCMGSPCKRHVVNDATRSLRVWNECTGRE